MMIANLLGKIYSWLALITMALGVLVAIMFALSFILGGETGQLIAVLAGKIMTWGIQIAAAATFAGIIKVYLSKEHSLTINVEKVEEMEEGAKIKPLGRTAL